VQRGVNGKNDPPKAGLTEKGPVGSTLCNQLKLRRPPRKRTLKEKDPPAKQKADELLKKQKEKL